MRPIRSARRQRGFNLLEILVALFILAVGLLGLAGTQMLAQRSELESYQRAQAMVLLTDIVDRINTNRKGAVCYSITADASAGTSYLGAAGAGKYDTASYACPSLATNPDAVARAGLDLQFIDEILQGAGETSGGTNLATMIGARACIGFDAATQSYTVAVAWQGTAPTFSPASWPTANNPAVARNCALGLYGADDAMRRVVWGSIMVASLTGS